MFRSIKCLIIFKKVLLIISLTKILWFVSNIEAILLLIKSFIECLRGYILNIILVFWIEIFLHIKINYLLTKLRSILLNISLIFRLAKNMTACFIHILINSSKLFIINFLIALRDDWFTKSNLRRNYIIKRLKNFVMVKLQELILINLWSSLFFKLQKIWFL
jgi:hypothetical protein